MCNSVVEYEDSLAKTQGRKVIFNKGKRNIMLRGGRKIFISGNWHINNNLVSVLLVFNCLLL